MLWEHMLREIELICFKSSFTNQLIYFVFSHVKDCISTKLMKIDISLYEKIEFIREIIRYQMGSYCFSGVIDCDSPDDLDNKWWYELTVRLNSPKLNLESIPTIKNSSLFEQMQTMLFSCWSVTKMHVAYHSEVMD